MKQPKAILIAFFLFVLAVCGLIAPLSASRQGTAKHEHSLTVYTTLPPEIIEPLAAEYAARQNATVNFISLSENEIVTRLQTEGRKLQEKDTAIPPNKKADSIARKNNPIQKENKEAAAVIADSATLERISLHGGFVPYVTEISDQVASRFHGRNDAWVGIWYDPVVFAINSDYFKTMKTVPLAWPELKMLDASTRVGMTDFLAAKAAGNVYISLVEKYGPDLTLEILASLHPKVVQYAKYLSTPARMTGMGEADFAIAVESEVMRYIASGYPIKIVYPEDGTTYTLTGIGLTGNGGDMLLAHSFADWLLSDEAQLVLRKSDFYYVPTNADTLAYKSFAGKNLVLFDRGRYYGETECQQLIDRWVKQVRFN